MEFWTKKFNSAKSASDDFETAWPDRLLIVTDQRIFVVTRKEKDEWKRRSPNQPSSRSTGDFEIVDSIPMEEILSISLESERGQWHDDPRPVRGAFSQSFHRAASFLLSRSQDETAGDDEEAERKAAERSLRRLLPGGGARALAGFCEPILRHEGVWEAKG